MITVLEARPSGPARAPADWRPRAAAEGRRPDAFHRPARPEPATRAATGGRDHHDRSPAVRAISRAAVAGSVFIHRSGDASMFCARHEQKRKRAAAIAIESLEDRVVLTAGAASVEIQYLRAINHLNSLLQRRVDQIQAMLTRRVAHVRRAVRGALTRSAARLGGGPAEVRTARAQLARSTATADAKINSVVGGADRQVGRFTASFDRQLAGVTGRFGRLNGTIRRANPYFAANFHNTLAAIDAGIPAEGQAAQGAVQGATAPVESAVAQAGTSEAEAVRRPRRRPAHWPRPASRRSRARRPPSPSSGTATTAASTRSAPRWRRSPRRCCPPSTSAEAPSPVPWGTARTAAGAVPSTGPVPGR